MAHVFLVEVVEHLELVWVFYFRHSHIGVDLDIFDEAHAIFTLLLNDDEVRSFNQAWLQFLMQGSIFQEFGEGSGLHLGRVFGRFFLKDQRELIFDKFNGIGIPLDF